MIKTLENLDWFEHAVKTNRMIFNREKYNILHLVREKEEI